jgi:son of sevenless-like protein
MTKNSPSHHTVSPIELARQMTLVEAEIFCLLKPTEFFHNAWNSKRKEVLAGNLSLLTGRFNQFASWISSLILDEKSAKDRGHLIEYFILVQRGL